MRIQAQTGSSLKERREMTMTDFRGVDFSTSPLRVSLNRATDAKNFINEYGINRKRHGWNQQFQVKGKAINGIFPYELGEHKVFLVHAGRRFYVAKRKGKEYSVTDVTESGTYERSRVDPSRLRNERSQAFYQKERMYIIGCGDFLVYGSWDEGKTFELRRVANDEDTFIPTTSISISHDGVEDDDIRATLDDVNYLCDYRINQMLGKVGAGTWTVDAGEIDEDSDVHIRYEIVKDGELVEHELSNSGKDKSILYQGSEIAGSVDFAKGKVTIQIDTTPPIEGQDNIYVTYRYTVNGYSDTITECSFGTLFGIGGNTDRLFLAGNGKHPHIDFHSEMDDYTYFGDLAICAVGSDAAPIGGYARLSDSTLVIFKENAERESSIFYRTGRYDEYTDTNGNVQEMQAVFPTTAGSIGESILSRYACANLAGDSLMLSKNGVFGIVLSDNVATTERYTRERSRSINERLLTHKNLENAVSAVFEGRYYLSVDGVCYVADSRYKYTRADDVDGSYNYEWWFFDNVPARVWCVSDGALFFGTGDGRVCVFDEGYSDRLYNETEAGDIGINVSNGHVTYREGLASLFCAEDRVTFLSDEIYALFLKDAVVEDGRIRVSPEEIITIPNELTVYADTVGDSGLAVGERYTVTDVDKGFCTFSLQNEAGERVSLSSGGFRLVRLIKGAPLWIREILPNGYFSLAETEEGASLVLTDYDGALMSKPIIRFEHRQNVVAFWDTPVLDFGTNVYAKTLLGMTISTEENVNGRMTVRYETKDVIQRLNVKGINVFSFDDPDFNAFSFDTSFYSSYTRRLNVRNFNYIIFRFESDNDCDCAVNSFTVRYKINKMNKGVR